MSLACALAVLLAVPAPGTVAPEVPEAGATPGADAGGLVPGSTEPVGTGAVRPAFEPGLAQEVQRLRAAAELRAAGRFAEAATIYEALYDGRPAAELLLAAAKD